jgi:hypothetical protein
MSARIIESGFLSFSFGPKSAQIKPPTLGLPDAVVNARRSLGLNGTVGESATPPK